MGGFSSNPLVQIGATAIDAYTGVPVASTALAASDARRRQSQQAEEIQRSHDLQASALQRQLQQQVKQRRDLLQTTLSAQRARLSAMGIGGGGSADALLSGLSQRAASDVADLQSEYGERQALLDAKRQSRSGQQASSFDLWSSFLAPTVAGPVSAQRRRKDDGLMSGLSLL